MYSHENMGDESVSNRGDNVEVLVDRKIVRET